MITLSKVGDSIRFVFDESQHYLHNGTIDVPLNSLSLTIDESDMATFRKSASNDVFISANVSEFGKTKSELIQWYKDNMVGGAGIPTEEIQEMIDDSIAPLGTAINNLNEDLYITENNRDYFSKHFDNVLITEVNDIYSISFVENTAYNYLRFLGTINSNYFDFETPIDIPFEQSGVTVTFDENNRVTITNTDRDSNQLKISDISFRNSETPELGYESEYINDVDLIFNPRIGVLKSDYDKSIKLSYQYINGGEKYETKIENGESTTVCFNFVGSLVYGSTVKTAINGAYDFANGIGQHYKTDGGCPDYASYSPNITDFSNGEHSVVLRNTGVAQVWWFNIKLNENATMPFGDLRLSFSCNENNIGTLTLMLHGNTLYFSIDGVFRQTINVQDKTQTYSVFVRNGVLINTSSENVVINYDVRSMGEEPFAFESIGIFDIPQDSSCLESLDDLLTNLENNKLDASAYTPTTVDQALNSGSTNAISNSAVTEAVTASEFEYYPCPLFFNSNEGYSVRDYTSSQPLVYRIMGNDYDRRNILFFFAGRLEYTIDYREIWKANILYSGGVSSITGLTKITDTNYVNAELVDSSTVRFNLIASDTTYRSQGIKDLVIAYTYANPTTVEEALQAELHTPELETRMLFIDDGQNKIPSESLAERTDRLANAMKKVFINNKFFNGTTSNGYSLQGNFAVVNPFAGNCNQYMRKDLIKFNSRDFGFESGGMIGEGAPTLNFTKSYINWDEVLNMPVRYTLIDNFAVGTNYSVIFNRKMWLAVKINELASGSITLTSADGLNTIRINIDKYSWSSYAELDFSFAYNNRSEIIEISYSDRPKIYSTDDLILVDLRSGVSSSDQQNYTITNATNANIFDYIKIGEVYSDELIKFDKWKESVDEGISQLDSTKLDTSAITTSITSASTDAQVPSAKAVFDAIPQGGGINLVKLTQSEYDALTTKDSNTLYIITE